MEREADTVERGRILSNLLEFSSEMGRRRVWRTALGYGAMVFVALQLGEIVFPAFGAPDWALKVLVVACLLGFPVALSLAWVFDITSHGIELTSESGSPGLRISNASLPRLALLAVTLSVVGGLGWWTVKDTLRPGSDGVPGAGGGEVLPASTREAVPVVRSLAVLPLDDFSETEGGEFFTAGLHEALTSQISQIPGARVVSRTSVVHFDRSGKAMPAIAEALGVDAVVEGSVFRSGNRVRITVQLIHGATDTHLWANSYEGTTEDAIGFQREIASTIADEIQAAIFGPAQINPQGEKVALTPQSGLQLKEFALTPQAGLQRGGVASMPQAGLQREGVASMPQAGPQLREVALAIGADAEDSASLREPVRDIHSSSLTPDKKVAGARRLAVEARDEHLLSLWTDPGWNVSRDDPRFQAMLQRIMASGTGLLLPRPQ